MGWFENQINERELADSERMADAISTLSEALTGSGGSASAGRASKDAVADILAYFGRRPGRLPAGVQNLTDIIEMQVRPLGIMFREVLLTPGWSHEATGPILALREDGTPLALIPGARGYSYRDHASGRVVAVKADTVDKIQPRAMLFYRPLPARSLSRRDIYLFMLRAMGIRDALLVAMAAAATAALGLVLPAVNAYIFGPVLEAGTEGAKELIPLALILLSIMLARIAIGSVQKLLISRVGTNVSIQLTAALMMRVLQLPARFFAGRASGDLASRILSITRMTEVLKESVLSLGLNALFSLMYLVQICVLSPALGVAALIATVLSLLTCTGVSWWRSRIVTTQLLTRARRSGWEYALINAIQKIRLANAERRAFSTWAERYADEIGASYTSYLDRVFPQTIALLGTLIVYTVAGLSGVATAEFMAFASAWGMVGAGISLIGEAASCGMSASPYLTMVDDIVKATPENHERRQSIDRLTGSIELDRVTFSYDENQPPVIRDLTLKIKPGQYVGIVGRSGCGKSTLLRLLLGFEEPQTGAIYYDGRDLSSLDARGLRRNIGVVLQEGRLFAGDIYSNIVVSAPWLTIDDAWRAAELAGIADDIRAMPMGMYTLVGEGAASISGGQRQRIMIARAVATQPKILMFDEATSALDNLAQKMVTDSLESLNCTRIVIAHRLSTVLHCDRILVLDQGHIVEDGSYEDLMAQDGLFADLMRRQIV